ncbi:hypothetical protein N9575_01515 [Flavobacteriaceae bacterium]|nr:hypothetical protein [Flavobacteriaceae bacterium]MDA9330733.1 hypothetical protein [Flavobacteriaceae bacterium]MDA9985068.1 hypothetical protein [Flavobacteriaceae bacterium]MDB4118202.1 hypothetical protein [Flavobacteriaceae bacterium]
MFKSSLFKLNKNRRYNYTPRYYEGKEISNIYEFDSKFSKYRDTYNTNDIGQKWEEARLESRTRSNRAFSPLLLVIIAVLCLIFLFIIDFDLSIFRQ